MLIRRLKLDYFGKFRDKKIDLQPGINLIYGENESGKSTIHTFIKGMFFGINPLRGRASNTKNDIYNRYLPWEYPGAYGGSMDIAIGEKKYRFNRSFLTSDKNFNVVDIDTGRELHLKEGLVKDLIPGLTESVYNNTVSFRQLKTETEAELADQVGNHMANLSTAKSKEVNVEEALRSLNKKKNKLKKDDNAYTDHIKHIQEEIQLGENHLAQLEELYLQLEDVNNRLNQLEIKKNESKDETYKKETNKINELPVIKEKYNSYKKLIQESQDIEKDVNELTLEKDNYKSEKGLAIFTSILLLLIIVTTFILTNSWPLRLLSIITLILIYIIIYLYKSNKQRLKEREYDIRIDNLSKQKENIDDRADAHHDFIMGYIQEFITEEELTDGAIYRLEDEIARRKEKLNHQKEKPSKDYEEVKSELNKINWQIKDMDDVEERLLRNKERYKENQLKLEETKKELEAVTLAIDTINELSADIHDSFGRQLDDVVSDIIKNVTNERYNDLKIDENLEVKVGIDDEYILMDKLSEGTIEQIYFALRLAVTELLLDEKMPILLDDSFALYDDKRIKVALKEVANRQQVIMFSCHSREQRILDELGIEYNFIEL